MVSLLLRPRLALRRLGRPGVGARSRLGTVFLLRRLRRTVLRLRRTGWLLSGLRRSRLFARLRRTSRLLRLSSRRFRTCVLWTRTRVLPRLLRRLLWPVSRRRTWNRFARAIILRLCRTVWRCRRSVLWRCRAVVFRLNRTVFRRRRTIVLRDTRPRSIAIVVCSRAIVFGCSRLVVRRSRTIGVWTARPWNIAIVVCSRAIVFLCPRPIPWLLWVSIAFRSRTIRRRSWLSRSIAIVVCSRTIVFWRSGPVRRCRWLSWSSAIVVCSRAVCRSTRLIRGLSRTRAYIVGRRRIGAATGTTLQGFSLGWRCRLDCLDRRRSRRTLIST